MLDLGCKYGIFIKEEIKPVENELMEQTITQAEVLVLLEGGEGEIAEKKSRFIATVRNVESEEQAQLFIEEMKKKYWDAKHNCSAYVIGRKGELTRCSDDGEPAQTAGRPMLEVLLGSGIRNVAVVVTRYFGGVLLGTGGLVRAYTQAVQEGLKKCRVGLERFGIRYDLYTDYNYVGKILYILSERGLSQEEAEYTDTVRLRVLISQQEADSFVKAVTEATGGKTEIAEVDRTYFIDKKNSL